MKAHKLLCAGAALALLGAPAQAQEQTDGFFAGFKFRGGYQVTKMEDHLGPSYMGFGLECGYGFDWGHLSAELGFMYKAGQQYKDDISKMQNLLPEYPIIPDESVDSRKTQLDGITLRLAYAKPFGAFSFKGGLQFGQMKFHQEHIADIRSDAFWDTYNGAIDRGNMSISPFVGISYPFADNFFVELNVIGLGYKSFDYVHVAGTVYDGYDAYQTSRDYIVESTRMVPHLEVSLGFRF